MTFFTFGGDAPELHAGRCINSRHAGARCTKCVAACPAQAIALAGQEPQLEEAACVRCGACLPVCPTDAYTSAQDYEGRLVATVTSLPPEPTALVCAAHQAPAVTHARVGAAVQHRRCLAALAPAHLLELSAGGRGLWLDDSPCAQCPIGVAQVRLQQSVDAARSLLQGAGLPPAIMLASEQPPGAEVRTKRVPLYDGAQPPMNRRAFLARFRSNQTGRAEVEEHVDAWLQRGAPLSTRLPQQMPQSHRALLAALGRLGELDGKRPEATVLPLSTVKVDSECCSACGLCARFCPTGALQFVEQNGTFHLSFQPAACVGCGVCSAACPERAVSLDALRDLDAVLTDSMLPLASGPLVRCASCGAWTAQRMGASSSLCHVCRQGSGVVTSLRDDAGLMNDLLNRTAH